ncbi:hypothetical protein [Rouxiella sp. WC2420]|uniref:NAD(+)--protein-arginine ADP-ribosyltransferase n=1 Tax=Rouxiella sp. WC2420 TaxID=3234145 RepID=A0AB39VZC1_9GAMM
MPGYGYKALKGLVMSKKVLKPKSLGPEQTSSAVNSPDKQSQLSHTPQYNTFPAFKAEVDSMAKKALNPKERGLTNNRMLDYASFERISKVNEAQGASNVAEQEDEDIIRKYSKSAHTTNAYLNTKFYIETDEKTPLSSIKTFMEKRVKDSGENIKNIIALDAALDVLPDYTLKTYRGDRAGIDVWTGKIKVGDHITNNAFLSTSASRVVAQQFINDSKVSKTQEHIMFSVMGRSGKNISPESRFKGDEGESEVLFRRDTVFKVLYIEKRGSIRYVIISEIPETAPTPDSVKYIYNGASINPSIWPEEQAARKFTRKDTLTRRGRQKALLEQGLETDRLNEAATPKVNL